MIAILLACEIVSGLAAIGVLIIAFRVDRERKLAVKNLPADMSLYASGMSANDYGEIVYAYSFTVNATNRIHHAAPAQRYLLAPA